MCYHTLKVRDSNQLRRLVGANVRCIEVVFLLQLRLQSKNRLASLFGTVMSVLFIRTHLKTAKEKFQIVTNNPYVSEQYEGVFPILYKNCSLKEILNIIRDMSFSGHKLLTHPLSGSVKPGETPYKSVLVSLDKGEFDAESVKLAENAILSANKFDAMSKDWSPSVLDDFQLVDYTLISSGIESATR